MSLTLADHTVANNEIKSNALSVTTVTPLISLESSLFSANLNQGKRTPISCQAFVELEFD